MNTHDTPISSKKHRLLFFSLTLFIVISLFPKVASAQGFSADPLPPSLKSLTPEQVQKGKAVLQQKQGETPSPPLASTGGQEKTESGEASPSSTLAERNPETTEGRPPAPERVLSSFEAYIQGKTTQPISLDIRQFGYDLFENPPTTFAPANTVPVSPDYLLGPGDELRINVWGQMNEDFVLFIDRDGEINLPQIGTIHLASLTFSEAKGFIRKEFGRYYKPTEVKVNMSMGRLRSIRVFVVGKAERPGSYTLSSFSTLINALFAAGGPSKIGTMRDIQVKRKGKTLIHFDLYDFLLKGNKENDIRLMPEDVIFIPTVGPRVGLAGHVKSPAIYEFKGKTDLRQLIQIAGGITSTGYLEQVQVERVFENQAKMILDINFKELEEKKNIPLEDGDIVKVFAINQAVMNRVELTGNLVRPGTYQWTPGMRVKDLIHSTSDFMPDTFFKFALVERLVPPDYHKEYHSIGLEELFLDGNEEANILLKPDDIIIVFNRKDLMAEKKVRIEGSINQPGEFEYRPNMTLSDLLKLAGGLKRETFSGDAEMTRVTPTPEGPTIEKISVDPRKALEGNPQFDLTLQEDDYLFIRTVPEWELYRTVQILGEVHFPGTYTSKKGETLSSLIERAGGFTDSAYLKGTVFTRESVRSLQQQQLDESIDRLENQLFSQSANTFDAALTPEELQQSQVSASQRHALIAKMRTARAKGRISININALENFKNSPSDLILEEGDRMVIPEEPQQVQVIGSVYNQTAFIFDREKDISDYIEKSGGLTEGAEKEALYVLKIDGSAVSRREADGFLSSFMSVKLDPGDTIVVPEKIEEGSYLREVKDITQILFQIATTAGILIVAF